MRQRSGYVLTVLLLAMIVLVCAIFYAVALAPLWVSVAVAVSLIVALVFNVIRLNRAPKKK